MWALISALGGLAGSEQHTESWLVEGGAFLPSWPRVQAVASQILPLQPVSACVLPRHDHSSKLNFRVFIIVTQHV